MRSDGCIDEIETYIRRAASAIGSGVPEEEVQERFEKEGCPPAQARLYVVAGRQLYQQQEDSFFGGREGEAAPFSRERAFEIGSALGVDWKKIPLEQFRVGLGVEMEHADVTGGDPLKTGRIVLAHLKEDRQYYSKLKRVGLERGREEKGITFLQEGSSRGSLWTVDYFASAPGEQRGVWRVAVVQAMSKDEAIAKVRRKESTNAYSVLTQISVTPGHDVPGYEPGRILREGGVKEDSEECHVCQPFTKLVRDPSKFQACMKRAEKIGELGTPRALYELIRDDLEREDQEVFICVCLDFRGQLRDYVEISRGQRHRVATDVEDVLRVVLASGCDGFAVAHCHPSGVADPSDADEALTKAIMEGASKACPNVHLLDHIVVGRGQWFSFAENNWKATEKVHKS